MFGSADGVLTAEESPGWSVSHNAPGAVLTLRRGKRSLVLRPADDEADPAALAAGLAKGAPARLRRHTSAGGLPFILAEAGGEVVGALSVDRTRYTIHASGLRLKQAAALLASLARSAPSPEPTPAAEVEPSLPEVVLFGGLVRLPRPPGARLVPQSDGWVVAVALDWSLGVFGGPSSSGGPRDIIAADFENRAAELARRGCKGDDLREHPLRNGWVVLARNYACRDALPGTLTFIGGALRPAGPPVRIAGEYRSLADFDAMLEWLAGAKDAALPPPRESVPASAGWVWAGLLAALAGLAALAARRYRSP